MESSASWSEDDLSDANHPHPSTIAASATLTEAKPDYTYVFSGRPDVLSVDVYESDPPWVRSALNDLARYLTFEAGWDTYGGDPITIQSVASAINILSRVFNRNTPRPAVVPTSLGGIQLEWHINGIDLEIEIEPAGEFEFFFIDESTGTKETEDELTDLDRLREIVSRLSAA